MRKAKSIDQLYSEVRDYDYVLTTDAALATALNAKIDDFRLGGFAYTPRQIAGILETSILGRKAYSDLEVVESIEKDTGYDFGYIHGEIQNIRDIMCHTSEVEKYLTTKKSRTVYQLFRELPTQQKAMAIYQPEIYLNQFSKRRPAVIGIELFDDLDKHFVPLDHDEIDMFGDGDYDIPTIHAIGNDRQIAGSIVDLIDETTSLDTAIVLDADAPIADAVRAALYRNNIPFKNSLDVKDLSQIRDFIEFVTLAMDFHTLRVGDVRELFSGYLKGNRKDDEKYSFLEPKYDNYLLHRAPLGDNPDPTTKRLMETMEAMKAITFGEALERLFEGWPQRKTSVAILLDQMHLTGRKVTLPLVNRLTYAVNNIGDLKHNEQVPEYEKKGVLLADCRKALYIDRSLVFFIGLDESWENTANGKDYVDKQKLDEDNALRMSVLLQQGSQRIYAVKPVTKGKPTVPCPTFQTIYSEPPRDVSSFEKLCGVYRSGSWYDPAEGGSVLVDTTPVDTGDDWDFSKTSYNSWCNCPIQFMFSELIKTEDNENSVFGNVLHDFAEFYFCYPDLIREKGVGYYTERLNSLYAGISNSCMKELDESKFRVFLNNLVRFIDMIRPAEVPLDSVQKDRAHPNMFMIDEGLERTSSMTEGKLTSVHPLFAKYDVCVDASIYDYKTGKAKDAKGIISGFKRGSESLCEFQPLIYLQALRERSGEPCCFSLFYAGDNYCASVEEGFDVRQNIREIILDPRNLKELVLGPDGDLFRYYSNTPTYAVLIPVWDSISAMLMEMADAGTLNPQADPDPIVRRAGLKPTKTNAKNISAVLKKAAETMEKRYLSDGDSKVIVPSDTLDGFVKELEADHATAGFSRGLPVYRLKKGTVNCDRCPYKRICLKCDQEEEE